jgi:hypothetical protein
MDQKGRYISNYAFRKDGRLWCIVSDDNLTFSIVTPETPEETIIASGLTRENAELIMLSLKLCEGISMETVPMSVRSMLRYYDGKVPFPSYLEVATRFDELTYGIKVTSKLFSLVPKEQNNA